MTEMTQPRLTLKRAPIGWNQDDFDVVEDGVIVGRIFKAPNRAAGSSLDVGERPQWRDQTHRTWLRADARSRDDRVRESWRRE